MESIIRLLSVLAACLATSAYAAAACPALLNHTVEPLTGGKAQSMCQYEGRVVLVVNTASECGYTGQYEGLQALYKKYADRGLVVLGFPSNAFGGQEPGSNKKIAEFCQANFGVTFPVFAKVETMPLSKAPVFAGLVAASGAAPDEGAGDGNPEMGFAGACAADQDDIALVGDKATGGQFANQTFVDRGAGEVELVDVFGQRQLGDGHLIPDGSCPEPAASNRWRLDGSPPEAEDLARMRITPQPLLNRKGEAVHAPPHIRHPARDPDLYVGRSFHWKDR